MSERACIRCGKLWFSQARGYDPERDGCRDTTACARRATMVTRPYVGGFNPDTAYANAPKLGDGR